MSLCNCIPVVPTFTPNCVREQKAAGIDLLWFQLCSYQFTDITDITEWQSAVLSGNIILIPHLKATRPAPTETTDTDAFGGEYTTGEIYSLSITDADMPYDPAITAPAVSSLKHPFWDSPKWNPSYWRLGWLQSDADFSVYGAYPIMGSNVTEQSGETALESRKFMGDIRFRTGGQFQPTPVARLDLRTLY